MDFERFRPIFETAAGRPRGAKGGRPALDANTLWDFREAPVEAGALEDLFGELNRIIAEAGFISRSGQVVDSSLVAAPRQRATEAEKAAIKEGRPAGEIWPDAPAKASSAARSRAVVR